MRSNWPCFQHAVLQDFSSFLWFQDNPYIRYRAPIASLAPSKPVQRYLSMYCTTNFFEAEKCIYFPMPMQEYEKLSTILWLKTNKVLNTSKREYDRWYWLQELEWADPPTTTTSLFQAMPHDMLPRTSTIKSPLTRQLEPLECENVLSYHSFSHFTHFLWLNANYQRTTEFSGERKYQWQWKCGLS